ncbi:motility associated factor glycosyltransferase family protein [Thalassotalea atypica]|uniref:motility associated factor glycosyltransferase family protein n=1 Tax=Thalassotalea atypica TaxID=2054316 RepID=UPI0025729ED3|nr:6-hydroxymethylpterin diphosphokinase MptE-like protein [Thalassotalea atypica]
MTTIDFHFETISNRWPEIYEKFRSQTASDVEIAYEQNTLVINNIQLTSNYDRDKEAKLIVETVPHHAREVNVFGVGLGDHIQVLLNRSAIVHVNVVILNYSVTLAALSAVDHPWLKDPRVNLIDASQIEDVSQPFCALISELVLANDNYSRLRDRVLVELDESGKLKNARKRNFENSLFLNEVNIVQDPDVSTLITKLAPVQKIYIAAAGPTLEDHLPWLAANNDNILIIAVDTAVPALVSMNIIPDVIFMIDEHTHMFFDSIDLDTLKKSVLVYFPTANNNFISRWPRDKFCAYGSTIDFNEINQKIRKSRLYSAGSVIHPSIDLGLQMGASEIILLGADFSFIDSKSHANLSAELYSKEEMSQSHHWVHNGQGGKNRTLANYRTYLRELEIYISRNRHVQFYNGSLRGALIEGTTLWQH